jgi:hypothetical protein
MTSNELNEKIEKKDEPDIYLMKGEENSLFFLFSTTYSTTLSRVERVGFEVQDNSLCICILR